MFRQIALLMLLAVVLSACSLSSGQEVEAIVETRVAATQIAARPTNTPLGNPLATTQPTNTQAPQPTATDTRRPVSNNPPPVNNCVIRSDWTYTYSVVAGDTLSRIAQRANTTTATLAAGNCISDPSVISVGQTLRLPNPISAVPTATQVVNLPNIVTLSASPNPVNAATNFTVTWNVIGGTSVALEWRDRNNAPQSVGNLALSGQRTFNSGDVLVSNGVTVITLVPQNNGQSYLDGQGRRYTRDLTVSVGLPPAAPTISSFTATAAANATVNLAWNVAGATSVRINYADRNNANVVRENQPLVGTLNIALSGVRVETDGRSRFILTPMNASNQPYLDANGRTISREVFYSGTLPQFVSFTANPATIDQGGSVTLNWEVRNAASATITRLSPAGIFIADSALPNLPPTGSVSVTVPMEYGTNVTYALDARDASGNAIQTQYVQIGIRCRFVANTAPACPESQASVNAASQTFQTGWMVWRADTREIYALFSNGTYLRVMDTYNGETLPTETPPAAGLLQPTNGFGKAWLNTPAIRQGLGWATAAEGAYTTSVETTVEYTSRSRTAYIYLRIADGRIVRLTQPASDGTGTWSFR
jgi:LysM repeat protein